MSWFEDSAASDIYDLAVDQSYYNVTSRFPQPVYLYTLSAECVKCPYSKLYRIPNENHKGFAINSASNYSFRIYQDDQGMYANASSEGLLCELNQPSGEFGAYDLLINYDGGCNVETVYEPVNIYFCEPMWTAIAIAIWLTLFLVLPALIVFGALLACLVGLLKGSRVAYTKYSNRRRVTAQDNPNPDNEMETPPKSTQRTRLKSLDCFRG